MYIFLKKKKKEKRLKDMEEKSKSWTLGLLENKNIVKK